MRLAGKTILLFLLGGFIHLDMYAQLPEIDLERALDTAKLDTSYFLPYEDEYNLMVAADEGNLPAIKLLVERGADINIKSFEGATPLLFAIENSDLVTAAYLLDLGADPDISPYEGYGALISAVRYDDINMAEYLIRSGANINITDKEGRTPLMHAVGLGYLMMTDLLIYYGANVLEEDDEGKTAFMIAAYMGYKDIAQLLLNAGAIPENRDNDGNTPLFYTVAGNQPEMVNFLLELGMDVNDKNYKNYTPLIVAIDTENLEMVKLLVEEGATINYNISVAKKPLDLAILKGNDDIITYLEEKGARESRLPLFDQVIIQSATSFNTDNGFTGFQLGLADSQKDLAVYSGAQFRLSPVRVQINTRDNIYYQYWENRTLLYLETVKYLRIGYYGLNNSFNAYAGLGGVYTTAKYQGAITDPGNKLFMKPSLGLQLEGSTVLFDIGVSYIDYKVDEISPLMISFKLGIYFSRYNRLFKKMQD
jgi:ankyrin repeat protein